MKIISMIKNYLCMYENYEMLQWLSVWLYKRKYMSFNEKETV